MTYIVDIYQRNVIRLNTFIIQILLVKINYFPRNFIK